MKLTTLANLEQQLEAGKIPKWFSGAEVPEHKHESKLLSGVASIISARNNKIQRLAGAGLSPTQWLITVAVVRSSWSVESTRFRSRKPERQATIFNNRTNFWLERRTVDEHHFFILVRLLELCFLINNYFNSILNYLIDIMNTTKRKCTENKALPTNLELCSTWFAEKYTKMAVHLHKVHRTIGTIQSNILTLTNFLNKWFK